jgi:hypothetical protein
MKLAARFIAASAVCIVLSACKAPQAPSPLPSVAPSTDKINLNLPPPAPPPGPVTGEYQITLVAQNCDNLGRAVLPVELRTRQYLATVQQDGADIRVAVITKSAITDLWGRIESDGRASLTNYYGNDQWDALWEFLTPQRFIEVLVEDMKVDVVSNALSKGTFQGYWGTAREDTGATESSCLSNMHSVAFVRR